MKCLAFDLGRVLFDFDYQVALDKMKNNIGVTAEKIIEDLFCNNFATDFEKGLVSSHDFYIKFKREFIASINYEEFIDIWCEIFSPKEDVISLVERLRAIYPIYLISNINELHFNHLYKKYPHVFSCFDDLILSFKTKSLKPEQEIYEELKKSCNCEYKDIVYIDDRQDLINEAKQLNLKCIQFLNYNQLLTELGNLKIAIPSQEEKDTLSYFKNKIDSCSNPLIVGIGNTMRADDGVAVKILEAIENKIRLKTLNAGASLENYLNKLRTGQNDLIVFIDAAETSDNKSFNCFTPNEMEDISLYFTHDSSLKLSIEYLQKERPFAILILAVKAHNCSFGETFSTEVLRAKTILEKFFLKQFSHKYSLKK